MHHAFEVNFTFTQGLLEKKAIWDKEHLGQRATRESSRRESDGSQSAALTVTSATAPDPNRLFLLDTYASNERIGAVLSQQGPDDREREVAGLWAKLSATIVYSCCRSVASGVPGTRGSGCALDWAVTTLQLPDIAPGWSSPRQCWRTVTSPLCWEGLQPLPQAGGSGAGADCRGVERG